MRHAGPIAVLLLPALTGSGPVAASDPDWDPWAPTTPAIGSASAGEPPVSAPVIFGTAAIRAYQVLLSPWLGGGCRFEPSCSRYALACVASHGLVAGIWRGADRISRCHEWADLGGYAPLPSGRFADPRP